MKKSNMNTTKIAGVDLFRFLLTLVIIWHHGEMMFFPFYKMSSRIFSTSYLVVEGFFLLSGYLLARSIAQRMEKSLPSEQAFGYYIWHRFKRIYKPFFFALIAGSAIFIGEAIFRHKIFPWMVLPSHLLMLDHLIVFRSLVGTWYVPVLFWGGCLLSALVFFKPKTAYCVWLPFIALAGYSWIFHQYGKFADVHSQITSLPFASAGLVRGLASMATGMCLFHLMENEKVKAFFQHLRGCWLMELACWAGLVYLMFMRKPSEADFNAVFYWLVILALLGSGRCLLGRVETGILRRFWSWVTPASYYIFLMHICIISLFPFSYWSRQSEMYALGMATIACVAAGIIMKILEPYFYKGLLWGAKKCFWRSELENNEK